VPDALAATVVESIKQHAHTGNLGDGKNFVPAVEVAIRIRTGEDEEVNP
jgi:nitrogen regulatory protein PII